MRLGAGQSGARAFAVVLLVVAAPATAQLLTPFEPVSPDGFEVVSTAPLTAEGATLTRRGTTFLVQPLPGVRVIRLLEPGQPVRTLQVGPPVATVALTLTPAQPVKNRDRTAQLEISVGGGESAPPVLRANVGRIEALEQLAPGRFRATYVLPQTRFPEVAVVVAFSAWPHAQATHGAVGVLRVPLASAVDVPGRAEPGAEVLLTIAGNPWGPVRAASDGAFRVPVIVPPGFGVATSRATDRVGNRRTTPFDLRLPPTNQLACVTTPDHLPADGLAQARVLCATSDRFGARVRGARVNLDATAGRLSAAVEREDGVQEWAWTAPGERGSGVVRFDAAWRAAGVDSRVSSTILLGQGPVASASLRGSGEALVHLGSSWRALLEGVDSLGHPVDGFAVSADVPDFVVSPSDGGVELEWKPRGTPRGEHITLRVWGPLGTEPARLLAWVENGVVAAAVTDLSGRPVARQPLALAGRAFETGPDGVAVLGPLAPGEHELLHRLWPGLRTRLVMQGGQLRYPVAHRPPHVEVVADIQVVPPAPVNVRPEREGSGFWWWLELASGAPTEGRTVAITVDGQTTRSVSQGRQRLEGKVVTVVDLESMVAATGALP